MKHCIGVACLLLLATGSAKAADQIESAFALHDVAPDTNPRAQFWRAAAPIFAEKDSTGNTAAGLRMEVRSRWTRKNLYLLFVCPYEHLNLKPDPKTNTETNKLWNWSVAEAFIGSDFSNIRRYKEFEISPQGEWVDLDINLDAPHHEDGWVWNSGFQVSAKIDRKKRTWFGFMKIPYSAVDNRPARTGNVLRANFYVTEGSGPDHRGIEWQPTHNPSFHTPEAFGTIRLVGDSAPRINSISQ